MENNENQDNLNNDQLWVNRVTRRMDALKKKTESNHWERYIREFQGDFSEILGNTDRVIPLNLIYAYVRTEVPDLYLQDPYFEFTPKKETTIGSAKLKELAVNDLWHLKKCKREVKKGIQDGKLVSHGWYKVGYNANLGNLEEAENNTENSNQEDYFFYRINWRHVIFNDEAVDPPYDATWMGQKFFIPLKDAKANKEFNAEKRAKLVGVKLTGNDTKENAVVQSPMVEGDTDYVELYEIWDKVNKKVLIVSTHLNTGILHERPWPYTKMQGFPFLFLNFSFLNDDAYGISDVGMGEKHVLEKTKIRTAFLEHLKRGNRQLLTKPQNFTDEAKDAYKNGDDSALLEVENPEAVKALPYAPFQSDVFGLESRLDDDLSQIWGQRATDRAGKAQTQTRTKFELQAQGQGTTNRLAEERNIVQDILEEAAEKLSCLLEQYATEPYYVQLTGKRPEEVAELLAGRPSALAPGAVTNAYGFTMTNEDIKGPVDVRIKESSAVPLDKQGKIDLLKEMINLYAQLAALPEGPFLAAVTKMLVEEAGMHELTLALTAEGEFQAQQQQQVAEQQEQQQQLAAGTKATELQLKAQEISTKQQKVESDAQLGLLQMISDIQLSLADINQKLIDKSNKDE